MKEYDLKSILQVISEASPSHLALVSFLVLPIIMNYWLETLIKAFPTISTCWKIFALSFLIGIYLFCLWWLARENSKKRALEQKRDQIIGRLVSNNWTQIGFDSARKSLTAETSDNEIISIIEAFPRSLRYVRMRQRDKEKELVKDEHGNQLYKHGIGLVAANQAEVESDEASNTAINSPCQEKNGVVPCCPVRPTYI